MERSIPDEKWRGKWKIGGALLKGDEFRKYKLELHMYTILAYLEFTGSATDSRSKQPTSQNV